MIRLACGTLLLFASLTVAQQQRDPQYPSPTTPPTSPQGEEPRRIPPDTPAPPQTGARADPAAAEISQKIQETIDQEPLLENSHLQVAVDDANVTLIGTVQSEQQRKVALSIAALYAGKREIVDRIKLAT